MSQKDLVFSNSILDSFREKAFKESIPLTVTIELALHCNFKCHHCYNFDRTREIPEDLLRKQMPSDLVMKTIDEVRELGTLYINFTGGEALLHPQLEIFINKVKKSHMEPRLKTNGSLLSKEKCQKLDQAGLAGLDISLYGFSEKTYQTFTRKSGMLEPTLNGIRNAKAQGFDVNVSIILHRFNIDEMKAMTEFCQNIQVPYQFSLEITDRYDQSEGARDFEMTTIQFEMLLKSEFASYFQFNNDTKAVQCACARSVCGISSTGEVYPCIGAPIPSGNLNNQTFKDIWKNSAELNKIRNLKFKDFTSCQSCEFIESCNRSSGSIYINTGDYTGCDELTLKQAKLRSINKT